MNRDEAKNDIMQAEKEFAELCSKEGIRKAFTFFADDNAIILSNDTLIRGKEEIMRHYLNPKFDNASLVWKPEFVDAGSSGDLGYTYGHYIFSIPDSAGNVKEHRGIFHTVWKKQPDGKWKFVWDN
jgi:ketosteroid isomerase-like protein